jgi:hypothetical protein
MISPISNLLKNNCLLFYRKKLYFSIQVSPYLRKNDIMIAKIKRGLV